MKVDQNIAAQFLQHGLCAGVGTIFSNWFLYGKSVRIYDGMLNTCEFGAYSYLVNGILSLVQIGNYSSLGHKVEIGFARHPLDWLSSHPFPFMDYLPSELQWPVPMQYDHNSKLVVIGNDVWIGAHAKIMGGVKVADGAVIAVGSIVTKDVPAYAIVGGNPAKLIRMRFTDVLVEKFLGLQWWQYDWPDFLKKDSTKISWDDPVMAIEQISTLVEQGKVAKISGKTLLREQEGNITLTQVS